jgi:hypothetical protein
MGTLAEILIVLGSTYHLTDQASASNPSFAAESLPSSAMACAFSTQEGVVILRKEVGTVLEFACHLQRRMHHRCQGLKLGVEKGASKLYNYCLKCSEQQEWNMVV